MGRTAGIRLSCDDLQGSGIISSIERRVNSVFSPCSTSKLVGRVGVAKQNEELVNDARLYIDLPQLLDFSPASQQRLRTPVACGMHRTPSLVDVQEDAQALCHANQVHVTG